MNIWWTSFCVCVILFLITFLGGLFMWLRCPKKINYLIGYRTKRSMQSKEAWEFAHHFCGKFWTVSGSVFFAVVLVLLLVFREKGEEVVTRISTLCIFLPLIPLFLSLLFTEIALKKRFGKAEQKDDSDIGE